ncbi:MAG: hypothetical protein WAY88_00810, partial [Minisyncoccia bacterium]
MNTLFPKISAILFGIVFLLGGASTAFGAEFHYYYTEIGTPTKIVSEAYPTKTSCQDVWKTKDTTKFHVSPCEEITLADATQKAADQTVANSAQKVVADNAVANSNPNNPLN